MFNNLKISLGSARLFGSYNRIKAAHCPRHAFHFNERGWSKQRLPTWHSPQDVHATMQSYATAALEMREIGHSTATLPEKCQRSRCDVSAFWFAACVSRTFLSFSLLLCVADGPITAYGFLIFSRCSVSQALCCFDHPPVRCCKSRPSGTVNPVIISPGFLLYVCW